MKLEEIERRIERIERIEKNAEEVMRHYAGVLPEGLLTLGPEEQREVYHMLRLRIEAYPDGALLASGALGGKQPVFTPETTSPSGGRRRADHRPSSWSPTRCPRQLRHHLLQSMRWKRRLRRRRLHSSLPIAGRCYSRSRTRCMRSRTAPLQSQDLKIVAIGVGQLVLMVIGGASFTSCFTAVDAGWSDPIARLALIARRSRRSCCDVNPGPNDVGTERRAPVLWRSCFSRVV